MKASNGTSATAFVEPSHPASKKEASLDQFTNFHGMLCSPSSSEECIQSFDGTILFMPSNYTPETVRRFDVSARGVLTLFSYYLLVIVSLTGLSTLLRLTDFRMATEYNEGELEEAQAAKLTSTYNDKLRVEEHILDYCKRHTNAKSLYLKRRFEYQFAFGQLEVVMLHFQCDQNKLHLVEVYHFGHWFWRDYLLPLWHSLGKWIRSKAAARRRGAAKAEQAVKKD